jgi:hypothetical protein
MDHSVIKQIRAEKRAPSVCRGAFPSKADS